MVCSKAPTFLIVDCRGAWHWNISIRQSMPPKVIPLSVIAKREKRIRSMLWPSILSTGRSPLEAVMAPCMCGTETTRSGSTPTLPMHLRCPPSITSKQSHSLYFCALSLLFNYSRDGSLLAVGVSETFEHGDNGSALKPHEGLYIKTVSDVEAKPKSMTTAQ